MSLSSPPSITHFLIGVRITAPAFQIHFHSGWLEVMWPGQTWAQRLRGRLKLKRKSSLCTSHLPHFDASLQACLLNTPPNSTLKLHYVLTYHTLECVWIYVCVCPWNLSLVMFDCHSSDNLQKQHIINGSISILTTRSWPLIYIYFSKLQETVWRSHHHTKEFYILSYLAIR